MINLQLILKKVESQLFSNKDDEVLSVHIVPIEVTFYQAKSVCCETSFYSSDKISLMSGNKFS